MQLWRDLARERGLRGNQKVKGFIEVIKAFRKLKAQQANVSDLRLLDASVKKGDALPIHE